MSFVVARALFCRSVGLCFAFAFASLYIQYPGLFGFDGLVPVQDGVSDNNSNGNWLVFFRQIVLSCLNFVPPLEGVHVFVDVWADIVLVVGFLCSVSNVCGWCNRVCLGVAWMCYFALFSIGSPFLSFQWDILLLETGVLAFLWAPTFGGFRFLMHTNELCADTSGSSLPEWLRARGGSPVILWLVRFTLFKLMFMAGAVKIQARCPTWLQLTALDYHYATQCLPTPLAWYAHQLPPLLQQISVAGCLVIELPLAVWCVLPFRKTRLLAAFAQVLLQVSIILTGNYNFFNLLTIILCISLLDDKFFMSCLPFLRTSSASASASASLFSSFQKFSVQKARTEFRLIEIIDNISLFSWSVVLLIGGMTVYVVKCMFAVEVFPLATNVLDRYRLRFAPSVSSFDGLLNQYLPFLLLLFSVFFILLLVFHSLRSLLGIFVSAQESKTTYKWLFVPFQFAETVCVCLAACLVFFASLYTFTSLCPSLARQFPGFVGEASRFVAPFHVTSGYGLFRRMTGVGEPGVDRDYLGRPFSVVARPEIVLSGTSDGLKWQEIEFLYKPGALSRAPPWVAPHQPRLDWQMWFAALSSQPPGWFVHLVDKLLEGSPAVIALLDSNYPFKQHPPKQIRALRYEYDFTRMNVTWNRKFDVHKRGEWWVRSGATEYLFPIERKNLHVSNFLERQKWSRVQPNSNICKFGNTAACNVMHEIRSKSSRFSDWMSVLCGATIVRLFGAFLFKRSR